MRFILLATSLLLIWTQSSFGQSFRANADTSYAFIETVSGSHFYGHIVNESLDTVFLVTDDGVSMKLPRSSISAIDYKATKIPDHFWAFGGVFGTPAGGNFVVGSYWRRTGVRLAVGYWGSTLAGIELSLPVNLYRSEHTSHDVAFVAWSSVIESTETSYDAFGGPYQYTTSRSFTGYGPAYQVNLSGFSGEFGLAFGSGDFSSPQIMFQLGYVHEFR
jgi:hypothetical protein